MRARSGAHGLLGRPLDDAELTVERLDDSRAALDPVAAVEVVGAGNHAVGGVVDVAANDTVDAAAASLGRHRILERADEGNGRLDAILEESGERPVAQPQVPAHPIRSEEHTS